MHGSCIARVTPPPNSVVRSPLRQDWQVSSVERQGRRQGKSYFGRHYNIALLARSEGPTRIAMMRNVL